MKLFVLAYTLMILSYDKGASDGKFFEVKMQVGPWIGREACVNAQRDIYRVHHKPIFLDNGEIMTLGAMACHPIGGPA